MTEPQDPPVSAKAALCCENRWVLLRNERNEWELPGGRIDAVDETLEHAVRRECREELGIDVEVHELVSAYLFEVVPGRRVTIICYRATALVSSAKELAVSAEHTEVGLFTLDQVNELDDLMLPSGYRNAIELAASC